MGGKQQLGALHGPPAHQVARADRQSVVRMLLQVCADAAAAGAPQRALQRLPPPPVSRHETFEARLKSN